MKARAGTLLKLAFLGGLLLVGLFFLTRGRAPLDQFLQQLRVWGPLPFYAAFALGISFGVPPTAFLLVAGSAFEWPANLLGLAAAYTASLLLSYFWVSRLFQAYLDRFLSRQAPWVGGLLRRNPIVTTALVRLTPGFPYVLQNCLLVPVCRRPVLFLVASLPPVLAAAVLFMSVARSFLAGKYWAGCVLAALLIGVALAFKCHAKRHAAALASRDPLERDPLAGSGPGNISSSNPHPRREAGSGSLT
jgi:uncharacterized membrane protein YdjX (TVP38/TMEM64 family)